MMIAYTDANKSSLILEKPFNMAKVEIILLFHPFHFTHIIESKYKVNAIKWIAYNLYFIDKFGSRCANNSFIVNFYMAITLRIKVSINTIIPKKNHNNLRCAKNTENIVNRDLNKFSKRLNRWKKYIYPLNKCKWISKYTFRVLIFLTYICNPIILESVSKRSDDREPLRCFSKKNSLITNVYWVKCIFCDMKMQSLHSNQMEFTIFTIIISKMVNEVFLIQ